MTEKIMERLKISHCIHFTVKEKSPAMPKLKMMWMQSHIAVECKFCNHLVKSSAFFSQSCTSINPMTPDSSTLGICEREDVFKAFYSSPVYQQYETKSNAAPQNIDEYIVNMPTVNYHSVLMNYSGRHKIYCISNTIFFESLAI